MKDIRSPIDGRVAYTFEQQTFEKAMLLLDRADTAQRAWRTTSLETRIACCLGMLRAYAAHIDAWSEEITRMMGKPLGEAKAEFERSMSERVRYLCNIASEALCDDVVTRDGTFTRLIQRCPVGLVLDIAAWNYPLLTAVNVIVPSILGGNAVLIKHAEQTALVANQFEKAFEDAGAPAGLVQALHIDHPNAANLIDTRRFGYVAFTGSVRGGHEVYSGVARNNFIGVGLELGGKDAALVLPDANFDAAVESLVDGAFYNAGQSCCAVERIYVQESIFNRFLEAFVAKTQTYVVGNPLHAGTTMGPLVNATAAERMRSQIADATHRGARVLTNDARFHVPDASPCYVAPCVLDRVDHGMALMRDETFAPAIGIMSVRDENEGVRMINDSSYGLTASIWTQDLEHGQAVGEHIEVGTVFVNRCDYVDPALAWTGIKDSGHGSSLSKLGFGHVTRPKSFHIRRIT